MVLTMDSEDIPLPRLLQELEIIDLMLHQADYLRWYIQLSTLALFHPQTLLKDAACAGYLIYGGANENWHYL